MGHVETRRHQRVIGAVTDITARTYLSVLATETGATGLRIGIDCQMEAYGSINHADLRGMLNG